MAGLIPVGGIAKWKEALGGSAHEGNTVTPLVGGPATFQSVYEAISTATKIGHYIYLLGWWVDLDVPLSNAATPTSGGQQRPDTLRAIFAKAVTQGVQVRVIAWDQWSDSTNKKSIGWLNKLADSMPKSKRDGVDCAGILDGRTLPAGSRHRPSGIETLAPSNFLENLFPGADNVPLGSHHQKIVLVRGGQGLIGFCGGVDVNIDRIANPENRPGNPQQDVHCRLVGPATSELMSVFVKRWNAFPDHPAAGKRALRGINDLLPRKDDKPGLQFVKIASNIHVVKSYPKKNYYSIERSIAPLLIDAIQRANAFIYIEDQYLGGLDVARAIKARLGRLQHVLFVVPAPSIEPIFAPKRQEFLNILGYTGKPGSKVRAYYRISRGKSKFGPLTYIHSKSWIVDDVFAVVGSANVNRRGWGFDSESIAAVLDESPVPGNPSFAQSLRMQLWAMHLGLDASKLAHGWAPSVMRLWDSLPQSAMVEKYPLHWDRPSSKRELWGLLDPQNADFWDWVDPNADGVPLRPV